VAGHYLGLHELSKSNSSRHLIEAHPHNNCHLAVLEAKKVGSDTASCAIWRKEIQSIQFRFAKTLTFHFREPFQE
jgi:hypothetical protein